MDLSSRGGTVALLGTLLVNSCFSLLLRHTENNGEDDEDSGYDYDFRDDTDVDKKPKKVSPCEARFNLFAQKLRYICSLAPLLFIIGPNHFEMRN